MLKQIARRILRKELEEQEKNAMMSYNVFKNIINNIVYNKEIGLEILEEMLFIDFKEDMPINCLILEANAAKLFLVEDGDVLKNGVKISVYPPDCSKESGMYLSERAIVAVNNKNAGLTK